MQPKNNDIFQNTAGQQYVQSDNPATAGQGKFPSVVGRISKAISSLSDRLTTPDSLETKSQRLLEGTAEEREAKRDEIFHNIYLTMNEVMERRMGKMLVLKDMYENNLAKYTNVFGMLELNKKGHVRATYNYLSQIVDKLTNFLTSKPPITEVPARITDDEVEVERAQSLRYFLDAIHHQNRFKYFFKRSAHLQSLFGDTFIKGPWWDPIKKRIRYTWVEDLGQVYCGWKDNRFEELDWIAFQSLENIDVIKKKYGIEVGAYEGTAVLGTYPLQSPTSRWPERVDKQTWIREGLVTEYWDEKVMMIIINETEIVQYVEHGYGFIPAQKVENIHVDNRPWGKSDIDELIDANVELNERMGDAADSIRQGAVPRFKVVNDPNFDADSVKAGANGQFLFVEGDKADISAIPSSINIAPYELYIKNIMQAIYDLGLPAVAWGGHTAAQTSGRELDMQYQAITDKIENKRLIWEMNLYLLNQRILMLAEKYMPGMKKIIDGHYETDYIWASVLPTSVAETITNVANKRDRGMISLHTAVGEMGYKDPDGEIDKIVQEWSDPNLAPILGKNALLTQGIQKSIETVFGRPGAIPIPPKTNISLSGDLTPEQEAIQASHIGLGESEGAQGRYAIDIPEGAQETPGEKYPTFTEVSQDQPQQPTPPTMQTYQNTTPQPMSAPGSGMATTTSPEGAVAQVNQQAGGQ
ncbi:MAG: phage portal protein [Thaumarchaeota archaeon]|nr:phage portal protein [Nitrososphaerota archaeon]